MRVVLKETALFAFKDGFLILNILGSQRYFHPLLEFILPLRFAR